MRTEQRYHGARSPVSRLLQCKFLILIRLLVILPKSPDIAKNFTKDHCRSNNLAVFSQTSHTKIKFLSRESITSNEMHERL